jgi:type III pantothenate kinase
MTLAVNIGNSNAVFGLYANNTWQHIWRTPSQPIQTDGFYENTLRFWLLEANISLDDIRQTAMSSVVPALTPTFRNVLTGLFGDGLVVVGPEVYPALPLTILRPDQIGADLVANALAAFTRYHQNCVVVDFGTALTFTSVTAEGLMAGVAIAPGLKTAIRALFANTAQLPEVPIELPTSALGQNTTHAIQAGVVLGYEGLVRHLLAKTRAELGPNTIAIATGGLADAIPALHDEFVAVDVALTLDGIRLVGQLATGQ